MIRAWAGWSGSWIPPATRPCTPTTRSAICSRSRAMPPPPCPSLTSPRARGRRGLRLRSPGQDSARPPVRTRSAGLVRPELLVAQVQLAQLDVHAAARAPSRPSAQWRPARVPAGAAAPAGTAIAGPPPSAAAPRGPPGRRNRIAPAHAGAAWRDGDPELGWASHPRASPASVRPPAAQRNPDVSSSPAHRTRHTPGTPGTPARRTAAGRPRRRPPPRRKASRCSPMTRWSTVCSASRARYMGSAHATPLGTACRAARQCPQMDTPSPGLWA